GWLVMPTRILILPVLLFMAWQRWPSAGLRLFLREALVPANPGGRQELDSGGFLEDFEALLDRLGRRGCDFLRELPEFLVLCGRGFEGLAALRGCQLYDVRQRLRGAPIGEKIDSRAAVYV